MSPKSEVGGCIASCTSIQMGLRSSKLFSASPSIFSQAPGLVILSAAKDLSW